MKRKLIMMSATLLMVGGAYFGSISTSDAGGSYYKKQNCLLQGGYKCKKSGSTCGLETNCGGPGFEEPY